MSFLDHQLSLCVCVRYLGHELGLVLGTDGDVQSTHGVEQLVHTHRLAHAFLLEELRHTNTKSFFSRLKLTRQLQLVL